jgi:hypothetical protein
MKIQHAMNAFEKDYKKWYYIAFSLSLILLSVGLYGIRSNSYQLNNLTSFKNGVHVCFSRISKSILALQAVNVKSMYLRTDFLTGTEECFSKLRDYEHLVDQSVSKTNSLGAMVDKAYIANQKIIFLKNQSAEVLAGETFSDLQRRYHALDISQYSQMRLISKRIKSISGSSVFFEMIVLLSFLIAISMLFVFFISRRQSESHITEMSDELSIMLKKPKDNILGLEKNFERLFQVLKLGRYAFAFGEYKKYWNEYYYDVLEGHKEAEVEQNSSTQALDSKAGETASQDIDFGNIAKVEFSPNKGDDYSLSDWMNKYLKSAALKEIQEKMSIASDLRKIQNTSVSIDSEGLDILLYHTLLKILDKYQSMNVETSNRSISIEASTDVNQTSLTFRIENILFNPDELEYFLINSKEGGKRSITDINLEVMEGLLESLGLDILFTNNFTSSQSVQSARIDLFIPSEKIKHRELTKVVKGKKKDLKRNKQLEA